MIPLKTKSEIEHLRVSCKIVSEILNTLGTQIKPGITTSELDRLADKMIRERGGKAAPPEVGFPGSTCISVNEQIIHGVPGKRKLLSGDIVSIDITAAFDGFYGDVTATFPVGEISEDAKNLLEATKNALYKGIAKAIDGNRLGDISYSIQSYVESCGFSVVRDFVGHGIGRKMHEEPQVPNFGIPDRGPRLKTGMVLAIEPMVNIGSSEISILDDGWTAITRDGKLSAHFEHTIAILENGPEILTHY